MQEVYEFLKKCGTYYLATVEGNQPRVRPFGTVLMFEGKIYIQTGRVKDIYKQVAANNKAEICAMNKGEWIRIAGKLVEDNRIEPKQAMLDAHPSLQAMYKAEDENTVVYYLEDATATISSFTAAPVVINF